MSTITISRVLLTGGPGFFSRLANVRLLAATRELRGMEDTLESSQEQRRKIEAEIASIRADRAKLTAALLEATQNTNAAERKIRSDKSRCNSWKGSCKSFSRRRKPSLISSARCASVWDTSWTPWRPR